MFRTTLVLVGLVLLAGTAHGQLSLSVSPGYFVGLGRANKNISAYGFHLRPRIALGEFIKIGLNAGLYFDEYDLGLGNYEIRSAPLTVTAEGTISQSDYIRIYGGYGVGYLVEKTILPPSPNSLDGVSITKSDFMNEFYSGIQLKLYEKFKIDFNLGVDVVAGSDVGGDGNKDPEVYLNSCLGINYAF